MKSHPHHPTLFPSTFSIALAACLSLLSPTRSDAVLIAYEGYDYTAGQSIIGQNGGTGWGTGTSWGGNTPGSGTVTRTISSTSITYTLDGFTYGGGNSLLVGGADVSRLADRTVSTSGLTTGQDIYFSYVVQAQGGTGTLAPSAFTALYSRDSGGLDIATDNAMIFGSTSKVAARANSTTTSTGSSPTLEYNTTYLVVGRISGWDETAQAYRTTSIWLNPDLNDLSTPTATATGTTGGTGAFLGVDIRLTGVSANGVTFLYDDLRVGTSWDSVVIPEPGAAMLALAGAGVCVLRGRTRNRR